MSLRKICPKCKREQDATEYVEVRSKYHCGGRTNICISCLERLTDPTDLDDVDRLMRWLDMPFLISQWTSLYERYKDDTLRAYLKIVRDTDNYASLDWAATNEQWKLARENNSLVDQIHGANDAWLREMEIKWPAEMERTPDDYHYLENFYQDIINTQNLITATQRDDAKRLAELGLLINKKIRAGIEARDEMAMYHNIIKTEGFEPKNAKSSSDFDSVGEIYKWLGERGWRPNWHQEPQDSVDFTMKQVQLYLKRLVDGETSLGDQVEDRKHQLELAERLDNADSSLAVDTIDEEAKAAREIVYEDTDDLLNDFNEDDDEDCLN